MVRLSDTQKKLYNTYMKTRSNQQSGGGATVDEVTAAIAAASASATPAAAVAAIVPIVAAPWTSSINPIRAFSICCKVCVWLSSVLLIRWDDASTSEFGVFLTEVTVTNFQRVLPCNVVLVNQFKFDFSLAVRFSSI